MRQVRQPAGLSLKITRVGRWLSLATATLLLLVPGCSLLPFGQYKADESLRKQAQADPFPNAQQTGLANHQAR